MNSVRFGFVELFIKRCMSRNIVILCGDINRSFCEQMASFAKSLGVDVEVYEIIKAKRRDRIVNTVLKTAMNPVFSKIVVLLFIAQPLLYLALKLLRVRVSSEVLKSVEASDSVIWVGLHEDFDVSLLVDSKLHKAMRGKNLMWLGYPREETARKLSVPYEEYFNSYLNAYNVSWEELREIAEKLKNQISRGETLRVKTQLGSDFTLRYKPGDFFAWYGVMSEKALSEGRLTLLLPAGEIGVSSLKHPLEINGRIYFDVPCILYDEVVSGVEVTVSNGQVVDYSVERGGRMVSKYFGFRDAKKVYEFSFGLNPAIKPCGSKYLDEKAYRTVHVGFARPWTPLHMDFVISNPRILINGCELNW